MMTVARDSTNRRSRRFRARPISFYTSPFSPLGNRGGQPRPSSGKTSPPPRIQACQAVESLLTNDFVFTSPYDYRIDRETYFKRCWPYSEKSPTYGIEKLFEKGNEAFILYDCKTKNGGSSRNTEFFTIEGSKIKQIEVYFGSASKEPV